MVEVRHFLRCFSRNFFFTELFTNSVQIVKKYRTFHGAFHRYFLAPIFSPIRTNRRKYRTFHGTFHRTFYFSSKSGTFFSRLFDQTWVFQWTELELNSELNWTTFPIQIKVWTELELNSELNWTTFPIQIKGELFSELKTNRKKFSTCVL